MTDHDNQLVPLSADLELRPARSSPVSLRRLLGPMFERCVVDIEESTDRLKKLADAASSVHDLKAESTLRAKIIDQCTQILRLCRADSTTADDEPPRLRSQEDVPDYLHLPKQVREKFEEGYGLIEEGARLAEESWGPHWRQRWSAMKGEPVADPDDTSYRCPF